MEKKEKLIQVTKESADFFRDFCKKKKRIIKYEASLALIEYAKKNNNE